MKGLAAIFGKGLKVPAAPESDTEMAPKPKSGGRELKFFQLASEASAEGDHEAAASAFRSGVKACMGSYDAADEEE